MHQDERLEEQPLLEVREEVLQFDFLETLLQILHAWQLLILDTNVIMIPKWYPKHTRMIFFRENLRSHIATCLYLNIKKMIDLLGDNPIQGIDLGSGIRKIRIAITTKET